MAALAIKPDGIYVDATFGRGGHAQAILAALSARGRLVGIDRDPDEVVHGRLFSGRWDGLREGRDGDGREQGGGMIRLVMGPYLASLS